MAKAKTTSSRKASKKKVKKNVPLGVVHVNSTFNNTLITISDMNGDTVSSSSGGAIGFKGSRKGTPFAAQQAAESAAKTAIDLGMREVDVEIKGPGPGRESAIRALHGAGLKVKTIRDVTPIPHNGCRPKKRRRV
jgi:small subunit ribosomal protein S11